MSWCLRPASWPARPTGVIYKACGDRRVSVCPPFAERYRQDTWQLIAAGLRGGKGVPAEVAGHPAVFLTLTAPSFGVVHSRRTSSTGRVLPCRPRRKPAPCPHGTDLRCSRRHDQDEVALGLPLCLDCYDHAGQVVWNAHVGELWRRTVIGVRRQLARVARAHGSAVRLSYAKVAEFQRRGVVHLHALLRLDGIDPADRDRIVPPAGVVLRDMVDAIRHAAGTAFRTEPHDERPAGWRIGWGDQLDVRPLRISGDGDVTDRAVVAYLAKYATKSTESTGHLSKRLTAATFDYYATRTRTPAGWSTPAGLSAPPMAGTGFGAGRTCSASAATSGPVPAGTRPPSGRCERPGGPGAGGSWWKPGSTPRTPRWSSAPGPTPARAGARARMRCWRPARRPEPASDVGPPGTSPRRREEGTVNDRMLSKEQAADWLGVSPRFVRRLVEERRIPFSRLGPTGSHIRIAESDLRAFVAAGRVEPIRAADAWRAVRGVA